MSDRNCPYYNWGGTRHYPSYPREYGARCEYHNLFFQSNQPDCTNCPHKHPQTLQIQIEVPSGPLCKGCTYLQPGQRFCTVWYQAIINLVKCDRCKGALCISSSTESTQKVTPER